eukprot:m.195964 g.195964  ORF g.195964 m.195964 type:complete len:96 (+) comp53735_c0_seq1:154-441(+)
MEPLEIAKVDLVLAYTLNSLFWMHMSAKGTVPVDHPVKKELERIQDYMKKLKAAEKQAQNKEVQQKPKLDLEPSQRLIAHGLSNPGLPSLILAFS